MNISVFIQNHMNEILKEWDLFARTLLPADSAVTAHALRDHAHDILLEITQDIERRQGAQQQGDDSGARGQRASGIESAADIHGTLRHEIGFTFVQVAAEFRALRATVLRLWLPKVPAMTSDRAFDMVRFNEAIDQALAESLVTYARAGLESRWRLD